MRLTDHLTLYFVYVFCLIFVGGTAFYSHHKIEDAHLIREQMQIIRHAIYIGDGFLDNADLAPTVELREYYLYKMLTRKQAQAAYDKLKTMDLTDEERKLIKLMLYERVMFRQAQQVFLSDIRNRDLTADCEPVQEYYNRRFDASQPHHTLTNRYIERTDQFIAMTSIESAQMRNRMFIMLYLSVILSLIVSYMFMRKLRRL